MALPATYDLAVAAEMAAVRAGLRMPAYGTVLVGGDGDSRVDAWSDASATAATKYSRGIGYWWEFLSKGRIRAPAALNFGLNNETSTGLLARIDTSIAAWVSAKVKLVALRIGTNDPGAGIVTATTQANCTEIERRITLAGIVVLWLGELPRGDSSTLALTGTNLRYHLENHRWQIERAGRDPMVYSVNSWKRYADRSSIANAEAGYANTTYLYDKLHPNVLGSYIEAKDTLPLINHLFPAAFDVVRECAADTYDATYSPKGAITRNPYMLAGTGGSNQASGGLFTGSLPQYWIAKNNPGSGGTVACVGSLTSDANGDTWWNLVFSGTAGTGSDNFMFYQDTTVGVNGVAIGTPYRAAGAMQIDAGQTGVAALDVFLRDQASNFFARSGISNLATDPFPTDALDGATVTDDMPLPAASTSMRTGLLVNFKPGAAVSATVRFRNLYSRAA